MPNEEKPAHQLMRRLTADTALGAQWRRLLISAIAIPAALGALLLFMLGRPVADHFVGATLITVASMLIGVVVILRTVRTATQTEALRDAALQQEVRLIELRKQAAKLQETEKIHTQELRAAAATARDNEWRLRQFAQRLQLATQSAGLGIWECDAANGRWVWDTRMLEIYGLTPAEYGGTAVEWEQRLHPEDRARVIAARQAHLAGPGEFAETFRIVQPGGAIRHVTSRGIAERAPDGRLICVVGTEREITAEHEATEQLARLNERLRRAEELSAESSELARVGGWTIDHLTSRVMWSGAAGQIHEVEENFQPTVDNIFAFFPPEARTTIEAALLEIGSTGGTMDLKVPLVTARGRRRWVRLIGRTDLAGGQLVRTHGAIQDITASEESIAAQRNLEEQLFQNQRIETVGTLAGGVAHDFNNLLTGIIGFQELIAETLEPDHEARIYLAESRQASSRARQLVEQILTFSRQSDGADHAALDLQAVIADAHRFLRATLPAQVTIEVELADDCRPVLAEATQLHQVLMNLGSNAAQAILPGTGQIKIALEPVRLLVGREATLFNVAEGDYARITFSDTGQGMDAGTLPRIFDPFFTTKKSGTGTGLGLAVVHRIIRNHRGAISVTSTPAVGTTFVIHLPTADGAAPTGAGAEVAPAPRGAGELVCVVDDETVVGSVTRLALGNLGYRTEVFGSAQEALEALRRDPGRWALLLTDQTMPAMQGHELALAVRQFSPDLPIVIMSGYFWRLAPQMLQPIGRVELLGKPFTMDEIAHAVHRALHPAPAASATGETTSPEKTSA